MAGRAAMFKDRCITVLISFREWFVIEPVMALYKGNRNSKAGLLSGCDD